jgi:CRP/FNR family cyclic AMP-dependent transcriptional regulator
LSGPDTDTIFRMSVQPEFLELLSSEERDELDHLGHPTQAVRGDALLVHGDAADRVLVLRGGRVKVVVANRAGSETVLAFRGPGALLGEQALVDSHRRAASVVAVESVEMLVIAGSAFRAYLERRPHVMFAMLAVMSVRLRDSDRRLTEFAGADVLGRVSARLVELCDSSGAIPSVGLGEAIVPITQDELAGWAGASLESTAKALRTLRTLGWVSTGRRAIVIKDLSALRTRAC